MSWFDDDYDEYEYEIQRRARGQRKSPPRRESYGTYAPRSKGWIQSDLVERRARKYEYLEPQPQDRNIAPAETLPHRKLVLKRTDVPSSTKSTYRYIPMIEADEPILDIRTLIGAVYEYRRSISLLIVLGMSFGAAAMWLSPREFTAQSTLYFDPNQIQFNLDSQAQGAPSQAAISALISSQVQVLTSNTVLQGAVEELQLETDSQFSVPGDGSSMAYAVAENLRQAVSVGRDSSSYIVSLGVTTDNAAKSAEIANAIVGSFFEYENSAAADRYEGLTDAFDRRLAELSTKVQAAESAVEQYRAQNDLVTAKGDLISEDRLAALNTSLVELQQKTIEARARVEAASRLTLEELVVGVSDTEVSSATLVELRRQYASIAATVGQMQSQMGARHPSLLAAQASLQGIRSEIRLEMQRIASIAKSELAQAEKAEQDTAKELATQKALKLSSAPSEVKLNDLELQASAAREIYEAVLRRTRETNEEQNISQSIVRILSKAEPPLTADGPGRSVLLIAGAFGGAVLGFGLGLAVAILRRISRHPVIRSYFSFQN
ncbi:GumC family protein [Labrenzia sp. CE80]|uniref:GumC family protein n=1 Tax=Labrenzia sp. CE80 TaxID=1788986 RepID=UPI0013897364|nr:GumC family protein [Labrenzia sp. CE80]